METRTNQNQIIIKTNSENKRQKLPVNLLLSLAAGVVTGFVLIFGLFWGVEVLIGL
ncbi:MAG: hypothetical protein ACOC1D_00630 [Prolixibacteraceae bacterium]